jgi:predicted NBD/HSP70 family sugar kinase
MASRYAGTNHAVVKRGNQAVIFRAIQELAPIARADLARTTGLNDKTVATVVDELVAQELVRTTGYRNTRGAGRPAMGLEINPTARFAVGVDLTRGTATCALVDMSGRVHERIARPVPSPWLAEHILPTAKSLVARLEGSLPTAYRDRIVGIGVGAPNPLSMRDGHYWTFDATGTGRWQDLGAAKDIEGSFGLPTYLEQNANTGALAELWFGAGRRIENFVLLNLGVGFGAGLVLNGDLYRGVHDSAGEIARMTVNIDPTPDRSRRDEYLNDYVSTSAILEALRAHIAAGEGSMLRDVPDISLDDAISALKCADPLAVKVFSEVACHLGAVIANIIRVVDPQLVLIGRELADAGDTLLDQIRTVVLERLAPSGRESLRFEVADVADAAVVGAATLALQEFFRAPAGRHAGPDFG